MNPNNYASLEASKRLVEAGIVLETEAIWRKNRDRRVEPGYYLTRKALYHRKTDIPAPSMAEVWRELPKLIVYGGLVLEKVLCQRDDSDDNFASYCWEPTSGYCEAKALYKNTNPTDALIDLLIWVRKEASHERSHNSAE